MPTYCSSCKNVEPTSRKQHVRRWLCMQHPNLEGMGFVAPTTWAKEEPYLRAHQVNGGLCKLYEPLETTDVSKDR